MNSIQVNYANERVCVVAGAGARGGGHAPGSTGKS